MQRKLISQDDAHHPTVAASSPFRRREPPFGETVRCRSWRRRICSGIIFLLCAACSAARSEVPGVQGGLGNEGGLELRSGVETYLLFQSMIAAGNLDGLVALFAEDATYRDRTFDFEVTGQEAIRELLRATTLGFGDRQMVVRSMVASGDTVVTEWVLTGRFAAPMLGVPPDHRPIELEGVSIGVVEEGRIVQHTDYLDRASLEIRLGIRSR